MSFRLKALRIERAEPEDAKGWRQLTIRFDAEHEACQFALGFGAQAEVLEPESLRQKVAGSASEIVAMYAGRSAETIVAVK